MDAYSKKVKIVLFCLFVLVSIYFTAKQLSEYWNGVRVDFPSFYYAADLSIRGKSPYNNSSWQAVKSQYLPNQDLYPYLNIPPSLILFLPLTLLGYQISQSLFLILNIIAIFLLIDLIFIRILGKKLLDPIVSIGGIFILLFPPVRITLSHGQVNLFVILLIGLFWWSQKEPKSPYLGSLALALAMLLKIYPGIFLLYLLVNKKFKQIIQVITIIVLFTAAACLILPEEVWTDWYASVGRVKYGGVYGGRIPSWKVGNQSLNGFITRFFMGAKNRGIPCMSDLIYPLKWNYKWYACVLLGYAAVGFTVLMWLYLVVKNKLSNASEKYPDLYFSMLLLTMFLAAPISWDHHLVFILPGIFVLMNHFIMKKELGISVSLVILFSLILAININLSHPLFQEGVLGIFVSTHFLAVLGLWMINLFTIFYYLPKEANPDSP